VVEATGDRLKMAGDIVDYRYVFSDDLSYDEAAFEKKVSGDEPTRALLAELADSLEKCSSFDVPSVEAAVQTFCESKQVKLKQIVHALRISTTGVSNGFGMFETLAVIGQARTVARIRQALARAGSARS
jgi:glutamyl/glutaminyl-tRNA synthetase